jgi:transposase
VPTLLGSGRHDLDDDEWSVLEHLLPAGKKAGRPPKWTKRQLIDGIRWRTRVGCPWRDVPSWYGSWQRIYGLFRQWQRNGTWAAVISRLQAAADAGPAAVALALRTALVTKSATWLTKSATWLTKSSRSPRAFSYSMTSSLTRM